MLQFIWALIGVRKSFRNANLSESLNVIEKTLDVMDDALDHVELLFAKGLDISTQGAAYGWEIGRGKPLVDILDASPDNPFLDPNWRSNVWGHIAGYGEGGK